MTEKRFKSRCYEKQKNVVIYDKGDKLFDVSYRDFEDAYYLKMKLIPVIDKLNELNDENEAFKNSDNITELETEIMELKEETKALKDKCSFMETIIENKGYSVNFDIAKGRWVIE